MRLIDAEDYLYRERPVGLSDELYEESHLYKSIMEQEVIQAIPLDKVKQARKDIEQAYEDFDGYDPQALCEYSSRIDEILDKLIAESEVDND